MAGTATFNLLYSLFDGDSMTYHKIVSFFTHILCQSRNAIVLPAIVVATVTLKYSGKNLIRFHHVGKQQFLTYHLI